MGELKLMKGNEALAEAAIRCGADAYFGYPITPQSEVIEYLSEQNPYERTGMVVLQAESELAAINMVYAAGAAGKHVMTSQARHDLLVKPRRVPEARRFGLHRWRRSALRLRRRRPRRPGPRYHPALTS